MKLTKVQKATLLRAYSDLLFAIGEKDEEVKDAYIQSANEHFEEVVADIMTAQEEA